MIRIHHAVNVSLYCISVMDLRLAIELVKLKPFSKVNNTTNTWMIEGTLQMREGREGALLSCLDDR